MRIPPPKQLLPPSPGTWRSLVLEPMVDILDIRGSLDRAISARRGPVRSNCQRTRRHRLGVAVAERNVGEATNEAHPFARATPPVAEPSFTLVCMPP